MKRKNWKIYGVWIGISLLTGVLSGLLSRGGMAEYAQNTIKPPLTPPAVVFPIVWTLLYILMGIGAARIWLSEPSVQRSTSLNLFVTQLVVNFFWSIIFFQLRAFDLAFLWLLLLWGLVLWMVLTFRKVDPVAAVLQIPYLLWLTLAAYLSGGVWILNS